MFDMLELSAVGDMVSDAIVPGPEGSTGRVFFNLCGQLRPQPVCRESFRSAAAVFVTSDGKHCVKVLDFGRENWKFAGRGGPLTAGFSLVGRGIRLAWEFRCDPDSPRPTFRFEPTRIVIAFDGACGKINQLALAPDENKEISAAFCFVFGVSLLLLGGPSLLVAEQLAAFVFAAAGASIIALRAAPPPPEAPSAGLAAICVALAAAACGGFAARTRPILARLLAGAGGGGLLGLLCLRAYGAQLSPLTDDICLGIAGLSGSILSSYSSTFFRAGLIFFIGVALSLYSLLWATDLLQNLFDLYWILRTGKWIDPMIYPFLVFAIVAAGFLARMKLAFEKGQLDESDHQLNRILL